MFPRKPIVLFLFVLLALVTAATLTPTFAADLTKKWRVSLALGVPPVGGFNPQDEISSAAGNQLDIVRDCERTNSCGSGPTLLERFRDPRDPDSVFGALEVTSMSTATLAVQYGVHKNILLEGSVGYQQADVGQVEIGVEFLGNQPDLSTSTEANNYTALRIPAGELKIMPISVTAMAHFRPRATFDPYLGIGAGYWVIGFDIDPQLDQLSRAMDGSRGTLARLTPVFNASGTGAGAGRPESTAGLPTANLEGASVDARDSFEWHLVGGAEITFKKRWSAFVDLRWVDVSRSLTIGFNGGTELGSSVPNFTDFESSVNASTTYGPVDIGSCTKSTTVDLNGQLVNCTGGGLIDLGHVVLVPNEDNPGTDCTDPGLANTTDCELDFVFEPDGQMDPGRYYVPGGSLDYDGLALQFGIRVTFGK